MPAILQNHYVLAVPNARAAAKFYVEALGFRIVDEPPGWVFVRKDNCMVMLGECPDDMRPEDLGCHNYFAYLCVDDVDAYHAQLRAKGVPAVREIEDQPWGMREFGVTTPDGHRITIGQAIKRPGAEDDR
jgi:catechol 2,3-dioxygenase-like lactoylglutathione lyase family enzyme